MSSAGERMDEHATPPAAYGLRLGVWYATLFIAGSLTIVYLTYVLTSASLAQRDRQIIDSKLGTYAAAYDNGGIEELASVVRAEQQTAPERLLVRVTDRFGRQAVVLSQQEGWDVARLETGNIRLPDGNGLDVNRWLGEDVPSVRVIMLTMADDHESADTALRDGARGYLVKGVEPDKVKTVIVAQVDEPPGEATDLSWGFEVHDGDRAPERRNPAGVSAHAALSLS